MSSNDLWRWDAIDLAQAIRLRRISSREATQACVERMQAVNGKLNAITNPLPDQALKDADAADAALRRGEASGTLHGVPVTIKENIDQKGLPTPNGVVDFKELIAPGDSPVVANWRKAGAIIIGRTNTPAFSLRWDTDNALRGRTRNPWAFGRTPGGSSGGAGASVAAGITALSHGNDYGGSIRYPAYCCGVAGIRPSMGRVPAFNPSATSERTLTAVMMAVQGPLARRVKDVRLGLAAMSGRDARDPIWAPAPLLGPAPTRPIRVALVRSAPGQFVHGQVAEAIEWAGKALADAGYAVEEMAPPSIAEAAHLWGRLVSAEIATSLWEAIQKHADPHAIKAIGLWQEAYPPIGMAEYAKGLAEITRHRRLWSLFLEQFALVVGPNSGDLAFEIGFDTTDVQRTRHVLSAHALMVTVNLLGLPSVAVPTGLAKVEGAPRGLPVGVQVIAGRFREDLALDAADIIEAGNGLGTPIDPTW